MKLKTPKFPSKGHHRPVAAAQAPVRVQQTAPAAVGTGPASPLKKVAGGLVAPARQRNAVVMLAGAAFIIVAAALGASVASKFDDSLEVLVAASPIVEGQPIDADDFRTVKIAAAAGDIEAVAPSSIGDLIGRVAAGPIGEGAMIHPSQFTVAGDETRIIVGAQLSANQYPAGGLKPGDFVRLIAVTPPNSIFSSGSVSTGEEVAFGEITDAVPISNTSIHYSIRIGESSSNLVAQLLSQNAISLALVDKSIALELVSPASPGLAVEPLEFVPEDDQ